MRIEHDARDLLAPRDDPEPERLLAELRDHERARLVRSLERTAQVAALEAAARRAGAPVVAARAALFRAEVALARGEVERASAVLTTTTATAEEAGDDEMLARTHHARSVLHRGAGDGAAAVRHAVRSVELTGEGAPPWLRAVHLVGLSAVVLLDSPSFHRAVQEALAVATAEGDPQLAVLPLNNLCWSHVQFGRLDEALAVADRLRRACAEAGAALPRFALDTIACAELGAGLLDAAWETVSQALSPATPDADGRAQMSVLTTAVRVLTAQGRTREALAQVEEARAVGAARRLPGMLAEVEEAEAGLRAASGDWEGAYRAHVRFHAEHVRLQEQQDAVRATLALARFDAATSERDRDRYRALAYTDALTGLPNRRAVGDHVRDAVSSAERCAVAIVDVDHFKRINDEHSHEAGDAVLERLGRVLRQHAEATPGTFVARLGGEEFVVVWTGWAQDAALVSAERLRLRVLDQLGPAVPGGAPVSVSIGVAAREGGAPSWPHLLAQADARLYESKRAGRNRVTGPSSPGSDRPMTSG